MSDSVCRIVILSVWLSWAIPALFWWRRAKRLERVFKSVELLGNARAGIRLVVTVAPRGETIESAQKLVDTICADVRGWVIDSMGKQVIEGVEVTK